MATENSSFLPRKTYPVVSQSQQHRRRTAITLLGSTLAIGGTVVVWNSEFVPVPAPLVSRARSARARVSFDAATGGYAVDLDGDGAIVPATTFADLAELALLPWYEASLAAVVDDPAWTAAGGIGPGNVGPIRKVLLIARSMLDVFSPVFPEAPDHKNGGRRRLKKNKAAKKGRGKDGSLWKELRTVYRHGYQKMGKLHDLLGLKHSRTLLETRVGAVIAWREDFVEFQRVHRIRRYLYGDGMDPRGCYYHQASHLFWADSKQESLPCGDDLGPASLRRLASVQLKSSLGYLDIIQNYTTVLPENHEINFHNLRKELRIFVQEYSLFGSVLVPDDIHEGGATGTNATRVAPASTEEHILLLDRAQKRLGQVNDKWTALDIYFEEGSPQNERHKLASKTDGKWSDFVAWESDVDLRGTMESVLERLQR